MKWIFSVLLVFVCLNLKAQQDTSYNPNHLYQPQELHTDLAFLKNVLEEAHPSLYRYTPKDTIDLKFEMADKQLNKPLTDMEFWKIATPLVVAIRSAHTVLCPSPNYVAWQNKNQVSRMPIMVYALDDRLFVAASPKKEKSLYRGAEILTIDDHSVKDILFALKKLIPAEGYNEQFVNRMLETGAFDEFYGQAFGFKSQYKISYVDSAGLNQQTVINAIKGAYGVSLEHSKEMLEQEWDELDKSVKIDYFNNVPHTEGIKIKSLTYFNYFRSFNEAFFKQLHDNKIENLIIDLRGDPGGYLGIGIDMMRYMIAGSVLPAKEVTATVKEPSFTKYIVKEGSDFSRSLLLKSGRHQYYIYNADHYLYSYPQYYFSKSLYVLIDKGTFSAASLFIANLKSQRKVTIIGEETGGGEAGTDGNGFTIVKMPATHLLLRLPNFWVATTTNHKNTGHGVMPDIEVKPTIAERVNNDDVVMKETLKLIMNKYSSK
jgi:hypothetical protein